uniref:Cytochrome c oxidase subunit 3 n=1 Tax=Paragyrodactylus variegatus TaxID=1415179 RepID=A0A076VA09_9PLAT|nr:cytochrome c oxidase subunit III [Paragyrodactylus variegatus]AIK25758.1 cytochrome c oxidase subunit III [Paragyrodactylus variegatus]
MNWASFYSSFIFALILIGLILWKLILVLIGFLMIFIGLLWFMADTVKLVNHYLNGFFLFITSEIIIFLTLFVCCFWFRELDDCPISYWNELPFLGSFLLLGSSITVTSYHMQMNSSNLFLLLTIILGFFFIVLQGFEFDESNVNLFSSVYHGCCFTTVSLHFSHVLIGVMLLLGLFFYTPKILGSYYSNLVVWYWHFVDYIWLFVYTVVYLF